MILAEDSPSPKTVCVAFFQSGQFRQPRDAALTLNKRLVVGTEVSIAIITEIAGRSAGGCLGSGYWTRRKSVPPLSPHSFAARVLVFHAGEKEADAIGGARIRSVRRCRRNHNRRCMSWRPQPSWF